MFAGINLYEVPSVHCGESKAHNPFRDAHVTGPGQYSRQMNVDFAPNQEANSSIQGPLSGRKLKQEPREGRDTHIAAGQ